MGASFLWRSPEHRATCSLSSGQYTFNSNYTWQLLPSPYNPTGQCICHTNKAMRSNMSKEIDKTYPWDLDYPYCRRCLFRGTTSNFLFNRYLDLYCLRSLLQIMSIHHSLFFVLDFHVYRTFSTKLKELGFL